MPRCLGIYQAGDAQCDGEAAGKTEQDRMPCVYRDRCVGFQKYLDKAGREPSFHLRFEEVDGNVYSFAKNQAKLDLIISKQISRLGIRNGRVTRRAAQPVVTKPRPPTVISPERMAKLRKTKPPGRSALQAAGRVRAKQFVKAREAVTELAQWYMKQLAAHSGRPLHDVPAAASLGDLFMIDRSESSSYIAVYGRTVAGKKIPITSLYYRPVTGRLEVRIAMEFQVYARIAKRFSAKLAPEDYTGKDGAFKVRIREVDTEKASIIAETLAQAMASGSILLPEVE